MKYVDVTTIEKHHLQDFEYLFKYWLFAFSATIDARTFKKSVAWLEKHYDCKLARDEYGKAYFARRFVQVLIERGTAKVPVYTETLNERSDESNELEEKRQINDEVYSQQIGF